MAFRLLTRGAVSQRELRPDVRSWVSPSVAETERNLAGLFARAEKQGAILVFDEADALFGKRTDVQDSHDKYANVEANVFLRLSEAHRWVAAFVVRKPWSLPPEVLRRLRECARLRGC